MDSSSEKTIKKSYREIEFLKKIASNFFDRKNFSKAIQINHKILSFDPNNEIKCRTFFQIGLCHLNKKNFLGGITFFTSSINVNHTSSAPYFQRGLCWLKLQKYDLAISDFSQSLTIKKTPICYYNLGICYMDINKFSLAISFFQNSIKMQKNELAYEKIGFCFQKLKKFSAAISAYSAAIKIDKNDFSYYYNRGVCYMFVSDYNNAKRDFFLILKMKNSNNYEIILWQLGNCFWAEKEFSMAEKYYVQGLKHLSEKRKNFSITNPTHNPSSSESSFFYNIGKCHIRLSNILVANSFFYKSILSNNNNPYGYYGLGITFFLLKQYTKSISNYTKSISIINDDINQYINGDNNNSILMVYFYRGVCHEIMGKYEDALYDYHIIDFVDVKIKLGVIKVFNEYYSQVNNEIVINKSYLSYKENQKRIFEKIKKGGQGSNGGKGNGTFEDGKISEKDCILLEKIMERDEKIEIVTKGAESVGGVENNVVEKNVDIRPMVHYSADIGKIGLANGAIGSAFSNVLEKGNDVKVDPLNIMEDEGEEDGDRGRKRLLKKRKREEKKKIFFENENEDGVLIKKRKKGN